jgi:hypothetical protein
MKKAYPILSSLANSGESEQSKQHEIALNKFDYFGFGETSEFFKIDINDFFSFIKDYLSKIEQVDVEIQIKQKTYQIDVTRLFIDSVYGDKIFFLKKYLEGFNIELPEVPKQNILHKNKKGSLPEKMTKLYISLKELLQKKTTACEDHPSLKTTVKGKSHNLTNILFDELNKRETEKIYRYAISAIPHGFINARFKQKLKKLINSLHYLEKKKFEKIYLSNFTGPVQYACILYSQLNDCKIEIYQHGSYLVHGIPSPYKLKYFPQRIHLYEQDFIDKTGIDLVVNNNYHFNRLNLNRLKKVENYTLIATSPPMEFDVDKYYDLWDFVAKELVTKNIVVKTKLHAADNITPSIIRYFNLTEKVELISTIETIPNQAITLNSSIFHELSQITKTIDFGLA